MANYSYKNRPFYTRETILKKGQTQWPICLSLTLLEAMHKLFSSAATKFLKKYLHFYAVPANEILKCLSKQTAENILKPSQLWQFKTQTNGTFHSINRQTIIQ